MKLRVLAALLCSLWISCVGTETGNPSFTGTLEYNAYTTNLRKVALSVETSEPDEDAILVDEAWLVLGDVSFVAGAGDAGACDPSPPSEVHSPGIGVGDHAAEAYATADLTLDAGEYCGVHVPFTPATAAMVAALESAPEGLTGHSILIKGRLPDGRALELRSRFDREVFLTADAAFEMSRNAGNVLVGFDVSAWLSALDLASADSEAGLVLIDETHNTELLADFDARVAGGTALFRDPENDAVIRDDSVRLASGQL